MIAKGALFEDTKPNAFVEELRVCLWSQAKETLPKSVFDYSIKALRKALLSLRSAYGPVGTSYATVLWRACKHNRRDMKKLD